MRCPRRPAHRTPRDGDVHLRATDTGDVDSDGSPDTVAVLQCTIGTGGPMQVVAFGRGKDGAVVALGQVVRATLDRPQWLIDVDVRRDGAIRVEVGDYFPGDGWPAADSLRQRRTYRWSGEAFRRTGGPTSFPPNPHLPS